MQNTHHPPRTKRPASSGDVESQHETYLAPPPPTKGRIIGIDCHPDTFTAAVFCGTTPHDARKLSCHTDMTLLKFLDWAQHQCTHNDLLVLEASGNSFEIHRRLLALGLRAVVLESCHVGKYAKTYADNDKTAAARIVLVYLQGQAPCVWVPDARTSERRELLHLYNKAIEDRTAASNSLKGYLNQFAVRPGSRSMTKEATETWVLKQRDWTPLQRELLGEYFHHLRAQTERSKKLLEWMGREICNEPLMLRCMKLLGIGMVNAFALLAIIGDVGRFERPQKLVAYLGLNPGQRESGRGKRIKIGVGKRGRGDMRRLLIQSAHAILRHGRDSALGKWGWKLFARKGLRNVAVVAIARKLVVQVWHLLQGHSIEATDGDKSLRVKLTKLASMIGKERRIEMSLPAGLKACVDHLCGRITGVTTASG